MKLKNMNTLINAMQVVVIVMDYSFYTLLCRSLFIDASSGLSNEGLIIVKLKPNRDTDPSRLYSLITI